VIADLSEENRKLELRVARLTEDLRAERLAHNVVQAQLATAEQDLGREEAVNQRARQELQERLSVLERTYEQSCRLAQENRDRLEAMLTEEKTNHKRTRCMDIDGYEQDQLDALRGQLKEAELRIVDAELFLVAKANIEEKRQDFRCPFSQMMFTDPVVASDGYTYEREYIDRWLNVEKANFHLPFRSPQGGSIINRTLHPNTFVKQVVHMAVLEEFQELKRKRQEAARANGGANGGAARNGSPNY
jgi:multidrug efflux pump subunit AcrA (membrane-fusion protein)